MPESERKPSAAATAANSSFLPGQCSQVVLNLKASSSGPVDSSSSVQAAPPSTRDRRSDRCVNLSQCHACGCAGTLHGGRGGRNLRPIKSGWRIVLLCVSCTDTIDSREVCSYCFLKLSEPSPVLSCIRCHRLVHRSCGFRQRNAASGLDTEAFVCVDCWVPNLRAVRFRVSSDEFGDNRPTLRCRDDGNNLEQSQERDLSDSCSAERLCGSPLESLSRPLTEISRGMDFEAKRRPEILVFQKKSKRIASNTLNSSYPLNFTAIAVWNGNSPLNDDPALVANRGEVKKEVGDGIGRQEVVLQFRRAMKGSRRIWNSDYVTQVRCSRKQDGFLTYQRRGLNDIPCLVKRRSFKAAIANLLIRPGNHLSNSSKLEVESHSVCGKFKACTENKLLENHDPLETEPSFSLDRELRHGCTKLEHVDDQNMYEGRREMGCEIHPDVGVIGRLVGRDVNAVEGDHFNYTGSRSETHAKEEEASCSNNVPTNSNGDVNSLDNEFKSGRVQQAVLALGDGESIYCEGASSRHYKNLSRIEDEPCSLQALKRRPWISDEWPKKYRRRCWGLKSAPVKKVSAPSEGFTTESNT